MQYNKRRRPNGELLWDEPYREFCVAYLLENKINIAEKYSYQFGIYSGTTLRWIYEMFRTYRLIPERILAFDSFEGLPDEKEGIPIHPTWSKGCFNLTDQTSTETIISNILSSLPDRVIPIDWHVGFFDQVLTPDLMQSNLKPAFWVDIDVDLYISTIQVLDFMFQNKLIVPETLVSFDDWAGTEEYKGGESLAWKEMCEKYSVSVKDILSVKYGNPQTPDFHWKKVFIVETIG